LYMLEKHRLTYLDHLGIDNFMPRRALPNALPSQLLPDEALIEPAAFSTADSAHTAVSDNSQANSTIPAASDSTALDTLNTLLGNKPPKPHLTNTQPLVSTEPKVEAHSDAVVHTLNGDPNAQTPTLAATVSSTPSLPVTPTAEEDIRFSLSVWRINDELMVIDSHQPRMALPTDRLLQNILRSIGYPLAQLPPSDMLRWPLIKDDRLSHPEAEARAMVQAFISAQCAKAPLKALLLLGKDAVRFALSIDDDSHAFYEQNKGSSCLQEQWQTMAFIAPSLVDMLQDPMQKRITWQALQGWAHTETHSA
jgi:hypothetical protein